jgi:hypothetical protein
MNESTTGTTMKRGDAEDFRRFALLGMALTMVLALLGNGFLAFVIRHSAGAKGLNSVQILILNNCVADILFALLTILPTCVEFLASFEYIGNDLSCRVIAYVKLVPMYASPFLLVAISFDRFLVSESRDLDLSSTGFAGDLPTLVDDEEKNAFACEELCGRCMGSGIAVRFAQSDDLRTGTALQRRILLHCYLRDRMARPGVCDLLQCSGLVSAQRVVWLALRICLPLRLDRIDRRTANDRPAR